MKVATLFISAIAVHQAIVSASTPARKRILRNHASTEEVEFGRDLNLDTLKEFLEAEDEFGR